MKMNIKLLIAIVFFYSGAYGQSAPKELRVDTLITGFHLAADFQGTRVYTKNGPSDLQVKNPSAFSFTLMPNATYQEAVGQLEMLLQVSINNGFHVNDVVRRDTLLSGIKTFYISYTETLKEEGYSNLVYNALYVKENTATLFVSGDLDKGKYAELFKKTFYAIRP
jgi:hypothetical protein